MPCVWLQLCDRPSAFKAYVEEQVALGSAAAAGGEAAQAAAALGNVAAEAGDAALDEDGWNAAVVLDEEEGSEPRSGRTSCDLSDVLGGTSGSAGGLLPSRNGSREFDGVEQLEPEGAAAVAEAGGFGAAVVAAEEAAAGNAPKKTRAPLPLPLAKQLLEIIEVGMCLLPCSHD